MCVLVRSLWHTYCALFFSVILKQLIFIHFMWRNIRCFFVGLTLHLHIFPFHRTQHTCIVVLFPCHLFFSWPEFAKNASQPVDVVVIYNISAIITANQYRNYHIALQWIFPVVNCELFGNAAFFGSSQMSTRMPHVCDEMWINFVGDMDSTRIIIFFYFT